MRSYLVASRSNSGFTLIELSIVLVIIGLIVGGVLVGQDLIKAAQVRAQVTQIEAYNAATNTFRGKYGGLPGDLNLILANQFGFQIPASCTGQQGGRDGNGIIDGYISPWVYAQATGETALFWQDLITAGFVTNASVTGLTCGGNTPGVSLSSIGNYLPVAKMSTKNFVYVYEMAGINWFGVAGVTAISTGAVPSANANIPVIQAYKIDTKVDDGLPTTGNVDTLYLNGSDANYSYSPNTPVSGGTSSSCYDTTTNTYSLTVSGGAGANCALSFRFQ